MDTSQNSKVKIYYIVIGSKNTIFTNIILFTKQARVSTDHADSMQSNQLDFCQRMKFQKAHVYQEYRLFTSYVSGITYNTLPLSHLCNILNGGHSLNEIRSMIPPFSNLAILNGEFPIAGNWPRMYFSRSFLLHFRGHFDATRPLSVSSAGAIPVEKTHTK